MVEEMADPIYTDRRGLVSVVYMSTGWTCEAVERARIELLCNKFG